MPLLRKTKDRTGSLYLRQHADNPVDWYLWADDAFALAATQQKPIFLSIGYSSCHWCHVMERESFSNQETAAILNEHFVSIKVDREERPDLDALYMQAAILLSGVAGWPLSLFLDDQLLPFFAGGYFPPVERPGLPAFPALLQAVTRAYRQDRQAAHATGQRLLQQLVPPKLPVSTLSGKLLLDAADKLVGLEDKSHGGFDGAPKFPHAVALDLLLTMGQLTRQETYTNLAERALTAMAKGAIFDPVDGGFHRYATDAAWRIPHFEKMLYDNALLARTYLHAYMATSAPLYRVTCERTLDYVLERLAVKGGFGASEDADSTLGEGGFYRWSREELNSCLGTDPELERAGLFVWDKESGLITQRLALHELAKTTGTGPAETAQRLIAMQRRLKDARNLRPRPLMDPKRVTSWNMLMAQVLIEAGSFLEEERYIKAAQTSLTDIVEIWQTSRTVPHCIYPDQSTTPGLLEDWTAAALALLAVAQHAGDKSYLLHCTEIAQTMAKQFGPVNNPDGRWLDAIPRADLITAPFMVDDLPTPSGRSQAALLFAKLATITGDAHWQALGEALAGQLCSAIGKSPLSLPAMAQTVLALLGERRVVITPTPTPTNRSQRLLAESWLDPGLLCIPQTLATSLESLPATQDAMYSATGQNTVQLCIGNQCLLPADNVRLLATQLEAANPLAV